MDWKRMLRLDGLNYWLVAVAFGMNLIWTMILLNITAISITSLGQSNTTSELILIGGAFIGPFIAGWITGFVAADGRGPAYGIYGSAVSLILIIITLVPAGIFGILVALVALAGGLNGGLLSQRRK